MTDLIKYSNICDQDRVGLDWQSPPDPIINEEINFLKYVPCFEICT